MSTSDRRNDVVLQPRIAYFANDLADATVRKRVSTLQAGGASVSVAGFRRASGPVNDLSGVAPIDLGETYDGQLLHRAASSVRTAIFRDSLLRFVSGADVVLARNLEMLLIAAVARARFAPQARLVYECLDIHSAMSSSGAKGRLLRAAERGLLRATDLLATSSPAFVNNYFEPLQKLAIPTLLIENKVLIPDGGASVRALNLTGARDTAGPPWRIGWFGVLRAQSALDALCQIAKALPGRVEVVIRGRVSNSEFRDFSGQVAETEGVTFEGGYTPADLSEMYADVHFTWALDLSALSGNSTWLLPNRIYEGGLYGSVPICQGSTETGRWAKARDFGLMIEDPVADTIALLSRMTAADYAAERKRVNRVPVEAFVCDAAECRHIVDRLVGA